MPPRWAIRRPSRSVLAENAYPSITMTGYSNIGHGGRSRTTYVSQTANASVSKLMGKHSVKFGADYRRIQAATLPANNGSFGFTQAFTQGPNPNTASTAAGDAFASFLLGAPATGDVNVTTPGLVLHRLLLGVRPGRLASSSRR